MKFTKKKDYDGSIRKVCNDDKTEAYGLVGTVGEMTKEGLLSSCDYDVNDWCFLSVGKYKNCFGKTREDVVSQIEN